ncbi:hypothetical protein L1049_001779 [Liquidambar formosana]|uniref:RING-type E3 ubiquitin transferase n=1 Tax=Liquidambar formosana TaxID=63359 RepID=A0AAP0R259_LIQFO
MQWKNYIRSMEENYIFPLTLDDPVNARVLMLWILSITVLVLFIGAFISIMVWVLYRRCCRTRTYARMDVEMQVIDQPPWNLSADHAVGVDPPMRHRIIPEIVYRSSSSQRTVTLLYDAEICPWCRDEFGEGELLLSLPPCGHSFHAHCIAPYMPYVTVCPCCRRFITSTDES